MSLIPIRENFLTFGPGEDVELEIISGLVDIRLIPMMRIPFKSNRDYVIYRNHSKGVMSAIPVLLLKGE